MTAFLTSHNQAFHVLGAKAPGQQWSGFDVSTPQARKGEAKLLVTTIWNFHHRVDEKGHRIPNENGIAKDVNEGTYWYRIDAPPPSGARKTHVAHLNRFQMAVEQKLPIVGVLKDVTTKKCSLDHTFDCVNLRLQLDKAAAWIQLLPRNGLGCETRDIDIGVLTGHEVGLHTVSDAEAEFQEKVSASMQSSSAERAARLALAPRIPKRVEIRTYAFERNSDVVAEVLLRAAGFCEQCKAPAPFPRRKDGTPYLEVHHRLRLADDGEDTVANAIAVCPNCHRQKHYG